MNKFSLLATILHRPWAIDERFAEAHGFAIYNLIAGGMDMDGKITPDPICFLVAADTNQKTQVDNFSGAPEGSIAVINIIGSMMKGDNMCAYGMATIGNLLLQADNNSNVIGCILYVDTPGGSVDGLKSLSDVILSIEKPVVTFVDGMMCSAGVWAGTSADYVIAENSTTQIGCIGTMISFADIQPAWEKLGVKFHNINSDLSPDKNKTFTDAQKGDYKGMKDQILNPLTVQFHDAVKANMPGTVNSKENVFTGKVYFAEDALKAGLIDEIGSFDRAIEKVMELAAADQADDTTEQNQTPNLISSNSTTQNQGVTVPVGTVAPLQGIDAIEENQDNKPILIKIDMAKLALVCALMGVASLEATNDGVFLSEDQLEKIEAGLASAAKVEADKLKAEQDLATANEKITDLEAANASLVHRPAADTSKNLQQADGEQSSALVTSDQNDFMANMNAVANRYL